MTVLQIEEPGRLDLSVEVGDYFTKTFTVEIDGAAQDLSAFDIVAILFVRGDPDSPVASFDVASSDKPNGVITFFLTQVQTDALDPDDTSYGYSVSVVETAGDNRPKKLLKGRFFVGDD